MNASPDFDWAAVLDAAIEQAVQFGPVGAGNERTLHERLRYALRLGGATKVLDTEDRLERQESGWTRSPGGIDVVAIRAADHAGRALGVECKVGKPDELLWDAIKIGQRCDGEPWSEGLEAAALVAEFTDKDLRERRAVSWFDAAVRQVDTVETIARWPEAWYGLMCGGRGIRPTSIPRMVTLGRGGSSPARRRALSPLLAANHGESARRRRPDRSRRAWLAAAGVHPTGVATSH